MADPISSRYDFVLFCDVKNGNPNGDPDAGNMPRIDPVTGRGIISDVCIKRKVRNYVDLVKNGCTDGGEPVDPTDGYRIYVQMDAVLNDRLEETATKVNHKKNELKKPSDNVRRDVIGCLCDTYYDIRTFGAVLTYGSNFGQVRGPVQLCFGESVDPVVPLEMGITRMAVAGKKEGKDNKTMGRKQYIPYGLYRVHGFVSAPCAARTGFSQADLDLLFEALMNMYEIDRSSARGLMTSRKLVVFKHQSALGNASSDSLFRRVRVLRNHEEGAAATSYDDYRIVVDDEDLPSSVSVQVYDHIDPSI